MIRAELCYRLTTLLLGIFLSIAFPLSAAGSREMGVSSGRLSHGLSEVNDGQDDDDGGDDDDEDDEDDDDELFVSDQLVVKLQPGVFIEAINTTYGTITLQTLLESSGIYLLQLPVEADVEELVEVMANDARLLYVEPNFTGELPEGGSRGKWAWAGTDPSPVGNQYDRAILRLPEAHALSRGDQQIVAVLDTGIQMDHPILSTRLTPERYDFVDDDPVPDEDFANLDRNGDGYVDKSAGHGTHVAGIINLAAPDAQIMPLRVLDANGRGNVFLIAEAVLYAIQNGADVINLSLGTRGRSSLLGEILHHAVTEHNVLVVAAAGNLNSADPIYPAAEESVIAVSAVDASMQKLDVASYGSWVDISAPGDRIYSAFPISQYAYWSGTSMAAPFVAGHAVLLGSLHPTLTAIKLRECILATAQPLVPELGSGLPDFLASLSGDHSSCVASPPDDDNDDESDDDSDDSDDNDDESDDGESDDDDSDEDTGRGQNNDRVPSITTRSLYLPTVVY